MNSTWSKHWRGITTKVYVGRLKTVWDVLGWLAPRSMRWTGGFWVDEMKVSSCKGRGRNDQSRAFRRRCTLKNGHGGVAQYSLVKFPSTTSSNCAVGYRCGRKGVSSLDPAKDLRPVSNIRKRGTSLFDYRAYSILFLTAPCHLEPFESRNYWPTL